MKILDTSPEIVALGEGLVEFAALERGRLEQVTTFRRGCGGDTSNFVVAAARLGASAGYITRVGDDDFGRACLALWQTEGVDISQVIVAPDSFTGIYTSSRSMRPDSTRSPITALVRRRASYSLRMSIPITWAGRGSSIPVVLPRRSPRVPGLRLMPPSRRRGHVGLPSVTTPTFVPS